MPENRSGVRSDHFQQIRTRLYESRGAAWLRSEGPSFADVEWLCDEIERLRGLVEAIDFKHADDEIERARLR